MKRPAASRARPGVRGAPVAPAAAVRQLLTRAQQAQARAARCVAIEAQWQQLEDRGSARALQLASRWMAAQVKRVGAPGLVLGASGGVDSSLCAVLSARAMPGRCHALIMPCRSDPRDQQDARELLDVLGIPFRVVDIAPMVDALARTSGKRAPSPMALGNLASRVRHSLLYLDANVTGALVVGTGNIDETYLGYSSKGTTADIFPITGLHKDEVRALLRVGLARAAPALADRIIARPPSPGYWKGQEAEHELGIAYRRVAPVLDLVIAHCDITSDGVIPRDPERLARLMKLHGVTGAELLRVCDLITRNHHKAFGSPALWRPEPLVDADDDETRAGEGP